MKSITVSSFDYDLETLHNFARMLGYILYGEGRRLIVLPLSTDNAVGNRVQLLMVGDDFTDE